MLVYYLLHFLLLFRLFILAKKYLEFRAEQYLAHFLPDTWRRPLEEQIDFAIAVKHEKSSRSSYEKQATISRARRSWTLLLYTCLSTRPVRNMTWTSEKPYTWCF